MVFSLDTTINLCYYTFKLFVKRIKGAIRSLFFKKRYIMSKLKQIQKILKISEAEILELEYAELRGLVIELKTIAEDNLTSDYPAFKYPHLTEKVNLSNVTKFLKGVE